MKLQIISLLLACSLALTGCGAEQTADSGVQTDTAAKPQQAIAGGIMTLAMHAPETLNPIDNRDSTVDSILGLIFEPLFVIDENMQVQPNLAESYNVSGNTVTLKLKKGVKWQDGNPVTADDVLYTLMCLEEAEGDTIYKACANNITSYKKTDDLTVTISYSEGLGSVGYSLCFPVLPKHYYRGDDGNDMKPMGNGSYRFADYTLVKEMNLQASETGLKGKPYVSSINVKIMPDTATEVQALEAGVIDAMVVDINSLGSLSTSLADSASEFHTNEFEFIGFNIANEMFANSNVRQGIAHLIPQNDIVKNIYINKMTPSVTPVNPLNSLTSKVGENVYEEDTGLASALFAAGGRTFDSFTFNILVNAENSSRIESARLVSDALNSVGMHTGVEVVSYDEYIKRLSEGDFAMYMGGVRLRENMDLTSFVSTNGAINYGKYNDANMDKLVDDCNSAITQEGYKACLSELNKYLSTQLPVIGIGFKSDILVTTQRLKGDKMPQLNSIFANVNKWYIG